MAFHALMFVWSREIVKSESKARGVHHLSRDLANVNALNNKFYSLSMHSKFNETFKIF